MTRFHAINLVGASTVLLMSVGLAIRDAGQVTSRVANLSTMLSIQEVIATT